MNVVLTGGAGFIGSNLCESLLNEHQKVICIDNFNDYYDPKVKQQNIENLIKNNRFKLYVGDILDKDFLNYIFSENDIDLVIHLAAMAGVRSSLANPALFFDVNVIGTLNVLEAMRTHKLTNMIYASSSSVYGNNRKIPFSELDSVDQPISPYAASKKAGELLCYTYCHLYNFNINCLRFFTVYGPKQRPDLAIYRFTKALINNDPIVLYGDGNSSRDYTHVNDIIQGIIGAIKNMDGFDVYNLGESRTISLNRIIQLLEEYTGKSARINYHPIQAGDVYQTYSDITKAKLMLGYSPQISIENGLADFVRWYKSDVVKEKHYFH